MRYMTESDRERGRTWWSHASSAAQALNRGCLQPVIAVSGKMQAISSAAAFRANLLVLGLLAFNGITC